MAGSVVISGNGREYCNAPLVEYSHIYGIAMAMVWYGHDTPPACCVLIHNCEEVRLGRLQVFYVGFIVF